MAPLMNGYNREGMIKFGNFRFQHGGQQNPIPIYWVLLTAVLEAEVAKLDHSFTEPTIYQFLQKAI